MTFQGNILQGETYLDISHHYYIFFKKDIHYVQRFNFVWAIWPFAFQTLVNKCVTFLVLQCLSFTTLPV